MKIKSIVIVATIGTLLGAVASIASTYGGAVNTWDYQVNDQSFESEGIFNIHRLVQFSGHVWTRSGASRTRLNFVGVNNNVVNCVPGVPNHVVGDPGCALGDPGCNTYGWFNPACWNSSEIRMFLGARAFKVLPLTSTEGGQTVMNMGYALEHELGHNFMEHVPQSTSEPFCIMEPGSNTTHSTRMVSNPCPAEIEAMGASFGHPREPIYRATSTLLIPTATWSGKVAVAEAYGLGFGAALRGYVGTPNQQPPPVARDSFYFVDSAVEPHSMKTCDYMLGNPFCPVYPTGIITVKPPAVAFDFTKNKWWFFTNSAGAVGDVNVSSTLDRVVFDPLGTAKAVTTNIATKNPPASAYDPTTNRIVLAFMRSDGALFPPCGTGCMHDVNVVSFPADGTGSPSWSERISFVPTPGQFGFAGHGSPTLACDSATANNCTLVVNGRDGNRLLYSWTFKLNPNGTLNSFSSANEVNGGFTDMTPSIAASHPGLSGGNFLLAVRGTDGQVYINSKPSGSSWGGWIAVVAGGIPLTTSQAPLVVYRDAPADSWDLLVAP